MGREVLEKMEDFPARYACVFFIFGVGQEILLKSNGTKQNRKESGYLEKSWGRMVGGEVPTCGPSHVSTRTWIRIGG